MENIIYDDSPLAAYLEGKNYAYTLYFLDYRIPPLPHVLRNAAGWKMFLARRRGPCASPYLYIAALVTSILTTRLGEGKADATGWTEARDNGEVENEEYAPRGPSLLRERLRDRLPQPLSLNIPKNSGLAKIHHACSVRLRKESDLGNRADCIYSAPSTLD